MESEAQKRRVYPAHTASGDTWSPGGPPHGYVQPQSSSSDFAGTGLSNNNGNTTIGGNVIFNNGNTANPTSTPEAERAEKLAKKRKELLNSLRFEQIASRQLSIKRAHKDTCRWFLTAPAYTQWEEKASSQGNGNLLWIKGKPGAGKSTLMSYLDRQLRSRLHEEEKSCAVISFFFNARGSDLEKSIEGLYRSLLLQLLEARTELQHILDPIQSVHRWDVNLLKDLFEQAAEESTTICLIDALDECQEDDIRDMVILFESILRAGSQLYVCFASRHYPHISTKMGSSITLEEQDQHENDISSYLNSQLNIGHSKQAEEIRMEMREKASGVFMWVVLVVRMLNKEYDKGEILNLRKRLQQLPSDLHDLFHSILARDNEYRDKLLLCVQWVLFAKRPLTPKELYFAIISGADPQSLLDYHSLEISEYDARRYILNSSKGLTESVHGGDQPIVQFIHESVRDFLLKGDGLHRVFPQVSTNMIGSSHEALRKCCLNYIQTKKKYLLAKDAAGTPYKASLKFPFLHYAVDEVLHHANQAARNGINQQEFLKAFSHEIWAQNPQLLPGKCHTSPTSMLYFLADTNMAFLIDHLPNIQSCFDKEKSQFGSPIICAIKNENFDCAQEMLRVQAKRFPGFCYEKFLKLWSPVLTISDGLISLDKDSQYMMGLPIGERKTRRQHTLVTRGTESDAVKIKTSRRTTPRTNTPERYTPTLIELIRHGGELVSIFFLQTESFDVNTKDNLGYTAAFVATEKEYWHLLKELHHRGADTAVRLPGDRTALHLAVESFSLTAVKLVIDFQADISAVDHLKKTPLHLLGFKATLDYDPTNIARLLIQNGAHVSSADRDGTTPWHLFSSLNYGLGTVRLLLDHKADIAATDNKGLTPLHAWCQGDWSIREHTRKAVARSGNPEIQRQTTPLPKGYLDVGSLLLKHGANVTAVDEDGQTPLHHCRTPETAELLINHNAYMLAIDRNGDTPLHRAASRGDLRLCQSLLHQGADPMARNKQKQTPFDLLVENGRCASFKNWLEWFECRVDEYYAQQSFA